MRKNFTEILGYQRVGALYEDCGAGVEGINKICKEFSESKEDVYIYLCNAFFLGYIQGKRAERARRYK